MLLVGVAEEKDEEDMKTNGGTEISSTIRPRH
jgi:hypothetical protein